MTMQMYLNTDYEETAQLTFESSLLSETLQINKGGIDVSKTIIVPPGKHTILMSCDAKKIEDPESKISNFPNFRICLSYLF